jgi:hypothetical protein
VVFPLLQSLLQSSLIEDDRLDMITQYDMLDNSLLSITASARSQNHIVVALPEGKCGATFSFSLALAV